MRSIVFLVFVFWCAHCLKAKRSPFDVQNPSSTLSAVGLSKPANTSTATNTSSPPNASTPTNTSTPTPTVTAGSIFLGSKTYNQLSLNLTSPSGMSGTIYYKIYASYPDDWTTIEQVETSGTLKLDYTSNISSYTITGLEPFQFYRVDIIAKDSANNKVLFPTFCVQMDPNISATVSCSTGPTGIVTTLAGTGGSGTNDGSFSVATFNQPQGITAIGNALYIVDTGNSRIRKLDLSTQTVSTLAGSTNGYTNATGVAAQFFNPRGATTDGTNLYVVDRDNYAIRLINPSTGAVTTFAGPLIPATSGLANGVGTAARFNAPDYIIFNGSDFYLSDEDNCLVRKITTGAVVTTHAGGGSSCPPGGNINSSLLSSSFSDNIVSLTFYKNYIFLTDPGNNNIRKIDTNAGGNVTTFINLTNPYASAIYGKYIYISENTGHSIYKYNLETGIGAIFVGSGSAGSSDGTGASASFNLPRAMAFVGNVLYVTDTINHKIRKIE